MTYSYDAASELTQAGANTFGFDLNGNRNTTGYVIGADNRILSDGTYTYTYDNNGNETQRKKLDGTDIWNFTYDQRNDLVTATHQANATAALDTAITYTYDVFGQRVQQSVDADGAGPGAAVITRFSYDVAQGSAADVWADLNGSSSLTTRRIFGDGVDQPLARLSGTTVSWYLADRQGSIREIADNSTGALSDVITYGGFGDVTSETSPSTGDRYKYTGREYDSTTGQYFYRDRWYDPKAGKFTSEDPLSFGAGDPNLTRYVHNGPTNATDPTGRFIIFENGQAAANFLAAATKSLRDFGILGPNEGLNHTTVWNGEGKVILIMDAASRAKIAALQAKVGNQQVDNPVLYTLMIRDLWTTVPSARVYQNGIVRPYSTYDQQRVNRVTGVITATAGISLMLPALSVVAGATLAVSGATVGLGLVLGFDFWQAGVHSACSGEPVQTATQQLFYSELVQSGVSPTTAATWVEAYQFVAPLAVWGAEWKPGAPQPGKPGQPAKPGPEPVKPEPEPVKPGPNKPPVKGPNDPKLPHVSARDVPKSPDSRLLEPGIKPGEYVYVRDVDGKVRVLPAGQQQHARVLGGSTEGTGAGNLTVGDDGVITRFDNWSGHFQFGPDSLPAVQQSMEAQGMKVAPNAARPLDWTKE